MKYEILNWVAAASFGAMMAMFWTPACAFDNDPNDRFNNPPVTKIVVRRDQDTRKLDTFIQVDEQVWIPVDGGNFSTSKEGLFDYDE